MESNSHEIQQLRSQLDILIHKQKKLHENVDELRQEIEDLQIRINGLIPVTPSNEVESALAVEETILVEEKLSPVIAAVVEPIPAESEAKQGIPPTVQKPKEKSSVESFLGENLASKIGIAIILIGIGVGVKYAIDKNLLGPLMRISLGYLAGAMLIGFGLISKKKYENLSAIMFAGGMAALYFVTFMAYDFYGILTKMAAFGMMVAFTVVTCVAAIRYDKQIIAIVGLVGAYSVPFLMSDGTGKALHLMIYMTIINIGILYLSFRKAWDSLYLVAFCCTWLIFIVLWLMGMFNHSGWDAHSHFGFLCVFYLLFYGTLVANKLHRKRAVSGGDLTILSIHSALTFIFGVALVDDFGSSWYYNGTFAVVYAASHLAMAMILKMRQAIDHLYYLALGLALMFATASIPMFFEAQGVTIVWSIQAALFFWLGRRKHLPFYEKISYIPLVLSAISMLIVWDDYRAEGMLPILNPLFLTGLIFSGSFFFMARLSYLDKKNGTEPKVSLFYLGLAQTILYFGLLALYSSFGAEFKEYWSHRYDYSIDDNLLYVWKLIFTMVYVGAIHLLNRYYIKDRVLAIVNGIIGLLVLLIFLVLGLSNLAWLNSFASNAWYNELEVKPTFMVSLRYISYLALAFMLYSAWVAQRGMITTRKLRRRMEIVLHITFVWVCCAELIHIKQLNGGGDLYRAGLTIFGGSYSFVLIGYGIWKKKPHLRKLALVLFGVTLLKLFAFDLARVDSGSKTIAFISLGVLLLVISFLYTKYKDFILADDEDVDAPSQT